MGRTTPTPVAIKLHKRSRELEVEFDDGASGRLGAEYLRVHSPSAEVTGHGQGEGVLVTDKEGVAITSVEPVGRYAVRIRFDDGHDTGLYTWPILYELCTDHDEKWRRYQARCAAARKGGGDRDGGRG